MALFAEIPAEGDARRYDIKSPVTLESIGQFQSATADEVRAAVERGRKAQREWATRSFDERAQVLWSIVDGMVERQDEIVDLVVKETGKALNEAISMEV
ncbi:MAG: aldehyde dehydrogenase family protein, partial [Myxococcota bacterium]